MNRAPGDVLIHLRRARDHVDRRYTPSPRPRGDGGGGRLSKFYFHRLFTATYGVTPGAHLSRRRVERAQDLLRDNSGNWMVLVEPRAYSAEDVT